MDHSALLVSVLELDASAPLYSLTSCRDPLNLLEMHMQSTGGFVYSLVGEDGAPNDESEAHNSVGFTRE